jgi:hypothetical protein
LIPRAAARAAQALLVAADALASADEALDRL